YSSAIFTESCQSLASAQAAKYQRIVDQLGLQAGDRVLEIGCGWGGFAEHAARLGIRVHGVTISPSQLAFGQERMRHQQLDHLAHL
ncbi:SAM-dependent methyltransferase, partial [Salmonella enterica]